MMEKLKEHWAYYISLTFIQLVGLVVVLNAPDKSARLTAVFFITIGYFVFAMVHHIMNHDLTTKIVVEYALFGCLGLSAAMLFFK